MRMSATETKQRSDAEELEAFRGRTTGGAAWSALGYGGQQIVRLAGNLVLTRLLFVEYFGLMSLVTVVMIGVALLSDIGIHASLIQNEREDRGFVDTLWTIGTIRGAVLCVIAWAAAGPIGAFYEEPMLPDLIRVAALGFVVDGFKSTKYHTHQRNLKVKPIVSLELVSQILGSTVMVIWASLSPSIWALVVGGLVSAFVATTWSHIGLSGRWNRFHLERDAALELYRFGRWILVATCMSFLFLNMDRMIFGKLVSMKMLGVYAIGANLAIVPAAIMQHIEGAIIFPVYSRYRHRGLELPSIFRSARLPALILGGWGISGILAGGPTIIEILYDPRYGAAGWMMQIIVFGLWFRILEFTNGSALLAVGKSRWMAVVSGAKVAAMAVFIPIGWHLAEFPGALVGLALSDVALYLTSLAFVLRLGLDDRRTEAKLTALVVGSGFGGWLAVQALVAEGWTNTFAHAAAIAIVVSMMWTPQLLKLWRRYQSTGHLFFAEEDTPSRSPTPRMVDTFSPS